MILRCVSVELHVSGCDSDVEDDSASKRHCLGIGRALKQAVAVSLGDGAVVAGRI